MPNFIIQLIIVFLIAGFILFVWYKLKPLIAQIIAEPFMSIVDILVTILIAAMVLFYAIIPLIKALPGLLH